VVFFFERLSGPDLVDKGRELRGHVRGDVFVSSANCEEFSTF
jgi:hypothetical protein